MTVGVQSGLSTGSRASCFTGSRAFAFRQHWDTDALKYIEAMNRAGAQLTLNQKSAVNEFFQTLKTSGDWSKFEFFYLFIGGTAATHAINGRTPGTFDVTWNGAVTHSGQGVRGVANSTTAYGSTGWTPSGASVLTQNNASIGIYYRTISVTGIDVGSTTGTAITNGSGLYLGNNGGSMYGPVNNTIINGVITAVNNRPGFTVGRRIASSSIQAFKNGTQIQTLNIPSGTRVSVVAYVAAINFNGTARGSANTLTFAYAGTGDMNFRVVADALNLLQAKLGRA